MKWFYVFVVFVFLCSGVSIAVPFGNGCIVKYVYLDGEPFEGAYVKLVAGDRCIWDGYTSVNGVFSVCELEYGTYYIWVDWNNDGIWDTENELVVLDSQEEIVYNYYDSPKDGIVLWC